MYLDCQLKILNGQLYVSGDPTTMFDTANVDDLANSINEMMASVNMIISN